MPIAAVASPPASAEPAGKAKGAGKRRTGPERKGRDRDQRDDTNDLLEAIVAAAERIADKPDVVVRRDAAFAPFLAQHRLAIDLEDGRQPFPELPAVLAIEPRPVCATQKGRHGFPPLGMRRVRPRGQA